MGVADIVPLLVASLEQNREEGLKNLQTHGHPTQEICICRQEADPVARTSAYGSSSGLHICQRSPLIEILQ